MTQLARANTASEPSETAIEERVVTARKCEEGLEDVPVAIAVVSRGDINATGVIIPESVAAPGVDR